MSHLRPRSACKHAPRMPLRSRRKPDLRRLVKSHLLLLKEATADKANLAATAAIASNLEASKRLSHAHEQRVA